MKDDTDVVYIPRGGSEVDDDIVVANSTANNTYPVNDFKEVKANNTEVKTNWEGEVVPKGPWYDKELFNIGGTSVTAGDVAVGTVILIIVILIVVAVCMFISWRKRKEIAAGVRRLSSKIRASIAGKKKPDEQPADPNEKIDPNKLGETKKEKQMLGDMFAHQNDP